MPAYDYRCKDCRHRFTLTYTSVKEQDEAHPVCPRCGADRLDRLIRRVAVMVGEDARLERLSDPARLAGIDENDPRAVGALMRDLASEMGEDAGPEVDEMIEQIESGKDLSPDDGGLFGV